jgi:pyruvate, orthophosphate dikinase
VTTLHPLVAELGEPVDAIGAKARGLVELRRLGLPVPPGFVVRAGARPSAAELAAAVADLGVVAPNRPLRVAVRSGASVSMPGMMATVLGVDPAAPGRLPAAIAAVVASWDSPRARTYRELHGIPHDLGTAVIVQAMVHGDRDERSGAGVAFSRDPGTGEPGPYGEVLFRRPGVDVVSGTALTRPLADLAAREPAVWADLREGLRRIEEHTRDAAQVEFTHQSGELWFLQLRPGGFVGAAAVRLAVDLADEGRIGRAAALRRVSAEDLRQARTPRIAGGEVLARGTGAAPGVASGRIATSSAAATRMAADGPVVLVRPETSPLDVAGLAAASGVVTARGGPTSHAAVVARALGRPAVVGVAGLVVTADGVRVGERRLAAGTVVTVDGSGGQVVLGRAPITIPADDPHLRRLLGWADDAALGPAGRTTAGQRATRPEPRPPSA